MEKGDSIISIGLKILSAKLNEVVNIYDKEDGEWQFKRIR